MHYCELPADKEGQSGYQKQTLFKASEEGD